MSEPVRMGVATSRPNSVSLRLSSALILIPMTENITQTAKFTAKASVLIVSAEICSRLSPGLVAVDVVTSFSPQVVRTARRRSRHSMPVAGASP